MLSHTAEYALRAVVWLAGHDGTPLTALEIASATQVPPSYLAKVLQALGRGGVVAAQRGKYGGFTLARPAAKLSILEVVNAVDPVRRIHRCPLHLAAHSRRLCPLHQRLHQATVQLESTLQASTIADLVAHPEVAHA